MGSVNSIDLLEAALTKLLKVGTILSGGAMILVVILQIIARFALPVAPHWTEEFARICFVFMISFASGLAVKYDAYINIDTLHRYLPAGIRDVLHIAIQLSVCALMGILFWHSILFVEIGSLQRSPSLQIPMSWIFASIPVLAFVVLAFTLLGLRSYIMKSKKRTAANDTFTL